MLLAFHLGRVYTLSLAEILAVFNLKGIDYKIKELFGEVLVLETTQDLDAASLQRRLGGVIKIMEMIDEIPRKKKTDFLDFTLKDYFTLNSLKKNFLKQTAAKIQFGLSIYTLAEGLRLTGQNKKLGMEIKRALTNSGIPGRLVIPEIPAIALPSVAVTNNQILERGAEIDLLVSEKKIYIGKTLSVQDFADYGRRDYQRPIRDAAAGLIPPKVAQVMINLAQVSDESKSRGDLIYDPFCGNGTILQEAMLMGYQVLGSDKSEKAIWDTEKNLEWFRARYKLPPGRFELFVTDAKELAKNLPKKNVIAVMTEGTLGPAYTALPEEKEMAKNFAAIASLYAIAFKQIKKILSAGTKIVIALPAYRTQKGYVSFPGVDLILKLGYAILAPIPEEIQKKYKFLKVTPRNSIIYDRKDQIVVREIIIFQTK